MRYLFICITFLSSSLAVAQSASSVYQKNIVAAEAFTGGNFESPRTLKDGILSA